MHIMHIIWFGINIKNKTDSKKENFLSFFFYPSIITCAFGFVDFVKEIRLLYLFDFEAEDAKRLYLLDRSREITIVTKAIIGLVADDF